ncbi:InlB B-repeat-containing protein [Lysinibacillus pakistanensis]|uniref:InlB B-repeat-containing protein n=1 Tax=Lysinibacillus pakistanensis TaxID=759811 RepID=UPI0028AE7CDA|nr:InlB B-repeat-containing protein [Lysinibacillus pakistanensis]
MKGLQVGLLFTVIYFIFIVNPISAHANEADYVWTNNKDGTVKIKDYIGTNTSIIIPNELGGKVVTEIGMAAFGEKNLTQVVIPDSVLKIGDFAFAENQLTYVELSNNLTSIGEGVFYMNKLTNIEIPDNVTEIGLYAFLDNELSTVKLPNALKIISDYAFTGNQLTSIELPQTLKTIGEMAFSENQLTSLEIPPSVTSIGPYAFATNQLLNVTIPLSITNLAEGVFHDNQLTSIEIPSNVTNIGRWAFGENRLSSLEIPKNVITVEDNAFNDNQLIKVRVLSDATVLLEDTFKANPVDLTIYGHDASTAQAYANQYNHLFELLTYKVIYNDNGSVQGNIPVDANMYQRNSKATVLDNVGALEKTGYLFNGWNSTANGDGVNYAVNSIIDIGESDITLYAKWTPNVYTVTFNTDGGTTIDPVTIMYDKELIQPADPTKVGHTFVGWYVDDTLNTPWDFAADRITGDLTLYAKWTAIGYTVFFETNGGTAISPVTVLYNEQMSEPTAPTKAVHTFAGWFKDETLTKPWSFDTDKVAENMTLYAKWEIEQLQYTVNFDTNGGSAVPSQRIAGNATATEPMNPIKADFTFAGWYKDANLTLPWNFSKDKVTSNITLYAKWLVNGSSGGGGYSPNPTPNPTPIPTPEEPTQKPTPEQPKPEKPDSVPVKPVEPKPTPQPEEDSTFSDVPKDHWAWTMIQTMAKQGVITGYSDGTFKPNAPVQRQHVALMLARAMELEPKKEALAFNDISATHPYAEVIQRVQQAGLFDGVNGNFNPTANMTRAQMAKILVLAFHLTSTEKETFHDVPATHWAYDYIAILAANGIALGDNGYFRPEDPVTRAQFAAFLYRALYK